MTGRYSKYCICPKCKIPFNRPLGVSVAGIRNAKYMCPNCKKIIVVGRKHKKKVK